MKPDMLSPRITSYSNINFIGGKFPIRDFAITSGKATLFNGIFELAFLFDLLSL